jgi:hypothetical protein
MTLANGTGSNDVRTWDYSNQTKHLRGRKTVKTIIAMTFALLLATTYVASAADGAEDASPAESATTTGQSYTIQETISKLEGELAKGSSVYTPCQLENIKSRLDDERRFYEVMISNS